jgi:single stranded DNA-binding protein
MNIAIISGNMGKDPEVRQFGERSKWSTSVAVNKRVKRGTEWEDQTTWINVAVWGSHAQMVMLDGLKKGSAIVVHGEIASHKNEQGSVWTEVQAQVDGVVAGRERVKRDEVPF